MLHEFIAAHRDEIIDRCRAKVATRFIPPPTGAAMDHGVPVFLDQLVAALHFGACLSPEINRSAAKHGHDLLLQGYTVSQVVHDYGDVCQSVTELALERDEDISTVDFRVLNRCLDDAIAGAVTEFGREQNRSTLEEETARGSARAGFLAHELRNHLHTAVLALEVLKTGGVGVAGSTGAVLERSLKGARALISRSISEVRMTQGIQNPEQVLVSALIAELTPSAKLEADARELGFTVLPVEEGVTIEVDQQVLAAALVNVLQNAFKFTKPHTHVTLRVGTSAERVLIEIEDECGGLPPGEANEMFQAFEQRGADRTGIGVGLAFSRWAVEANHGRLYSRNLPGKGCVFTVDLPRVHAPVAAGVQES